MSNIEYPSVSILADHVGEEAILTWKSTPVLKGGRDNPMARRIPKLSTASVTIDSISEIDFVNQLDFYINKPPMVIYLLDNKSVSDEKVMHLLEYETESILEITHIDVCNIKNIMFFD